MYNLDIPLYINISMGAKVTGNHIYKRLHEEPKVAKTSIISSCFLSL